MEVGGFAETSLNCYQTRQCHIPEGNYGQNPPKRDTGIACCHYEDPSLDWHVATTYIKLYSVFAQAANDVAARGLVQKMSEK
jgi:hypothetical protein